MKRANTSPVTLLTLALGVILVLSGVTVRVFSAQKGSIRLQQGRTNSLVLKNADSDSTANQKGLGLSVTLDSLSIKPHEPTFEIRVQRDVDVTQDEEMMGARPVKEIISRFPLDSMVTRNIGDTDFRFRVKAFYPDFAFSYDYPEQRDTITPGVTGVLLDLKTPEGPAIVTLRSDQPNRHTLGDIVGLGTSFTFYWELEDEDVIHVLDVSDTAKLKILFSGAGQRMHFVYPDSTRSMPFIEKQFYPLPGSDSIGFTVLYAFQNMDRLKAVPSTRSQEPRHPVAGVEVWKKNGPGQEAFLYPAVRGRIGGQYSIPGTGYSIAMELDPKEESRSCKCWISVSPDEGASQHQVQVSGGRTTSFKGYRLSVDSCKSSTPQEVTLTLQYQPGRYLLFAGALILAFSVLSWMYSRRRSVPA